MYEIAIYFWLTHLLSWTGFVQPVPEFVRPRVNIPYVKVQEIFTICMSLANAYNNTHDYVYF